MEKKTMRTLCIIAAVSQISLIFMILCGFITIGVESRAEHHGEGNSIKDKVARIHDGQEIEGKENSELENVLKSTNRQHKTADSAFSNVSRVKRHRLFNNLVDRTENKQKQKNPPSTARWCREVWENFSPEVDRSYSDISESASSSYESDSNDFSGDID